VIDLKRCGAGSGSVAQAEESLRVGRHDDEGALIGGQRP
jgi:hypothetical protein